MAFHYSPNIATNGLILYVDVANTKSFVNTASGWDDLTGKYGILALSGATYVNEVSGVLSFNGALGSSASTADIIPQTAEMTWDFWFKRTASLSTNNNVFSCGSPSSPLPAFSFRSSGSFLFSYLTTVGATTAQQLLFSPGTYSNNIWYNVTCTLTRNVALTTSTSIMYVNGVSVASLTVPTDTITLPGVLRMANYGTGLEPFSGSISSMKIYNRALTATEVLNNYNALKSRFGI